MLTRRRFFVAVLTAATGLGIASSALRLHATSELAAKLTDQEFWALTEELSEEDGYFRSDNFLSNETGYQYVIPDLIKAIKPGGVYLGVAPEINFTYIAALKPRMAFIIDIRRGNLHEHLLYKALFEMSADRPDFLSRLFSRKRPTGLTAQSSVADLFAAYDAVAASEDLYKENLKTVTEWLTRRHQFKLSDDDVKGVAYVYHDAFFAGGPYLNYSFGAAGGIGGGRGGMATYESLMLSNDGSGQNRSFLGTEESFMFVKDFETRNLLVPVVGNFGGPKAIRAVGKYVREHGATVTAFYLSNVEQYLTGQLWPDFCASVATLPLDDTSTYIFSGRGAPSGGGVGRGGGGFGRGGGMGMSQTRPILSEVKACAQ